MKKLSAAKKVKSVLALVPNERQIVDQFLFLFVEDLEMGDASSGPASVSGSGGSYNFANSWEAVSKQDEILKVFECHAVNSLWLFLLEGRVLRSRIWVILETTNFGASHPFLLQAHSEEETSMNGEANKDVFEDEEEDDWGFDEPRTSWRPTCRKM